MAFDTDSLLGIDIMDVRRQFAIAELQDQFAPSEWQRIQHAADPMREFYYFWTLKEAYIKAVGSGLSIEPNRLEFIHAVGEAMVPSDPSLSPSGAEHAAPSVSATVLPIVSIAVKLDGRLQPGWVFLPFAVDAHHLGAIAKGPFRDAVDLHQSIASTDLSPRMTIHLVEVKHEQWPVVSDFGS
jgi:hypothetical protein